MSRVVEIPSPEELRSLVGPRSPWAVRCGDRVSARRTALEITEEELAASVGVSTMTIKRIESGEIVPRDYLRLAVALALVDDVQRLWEPLRRPDVMGAQS